MSKSTAEKDKKEVSLSEKFVIDGNEKADELAKAGAMFSQGFVAQARASTVQQEREEVYAASFHCAVEEWKTIAKNSSPSPKENGLLSTRKERKQGIERSGV